MVIQMLSNFIYYIYYPSLSIIKMGQCADLYIGAAK